MATRFKIEGVAVRVLATMLAEARGAEVEAGSKPGARGTVMRAEVRALPGTLLLTRAIAVASGWAIGAAAATVLTCCVADRHERLRALAALAPLAPPL